MSGLFGSLPNPGGWRKPACFNQSHGCAVSTSVNLLRPAKPGIAGRSDGRVEHDPGALPSVAMPQAVTREICSKAGRRRGCAGKDPRSPAPIAPEAVCGAEAKS